MTAEQHPFVGQRRRLAVFAPAIAVLGLAALLVVLNPIVFVGDGDDLRYLKAATCFARHGFCIATNHWESRIPVVAPLGGASAIFGVGKFALALVSAIYSAATLLLSVALLQRQFGRVEAVIGGAILVATPEVGQTLLRVGVDLPELAWLLAALFCLQSRSRTGGAHWLLFAGLFAALAVETRATSLVALPVLAAVLILMGCRKRDFIAFGCGLAAPLVIQFFTDVLTTGDGLHHWRLQLGHTALPSSELPEAAAKSGMPVFNLAIIRAWPPAAGIPAHWSIRALVNLFASPTIGLALCAAGLLILSAPRQLSLDTKSGRILSAALVGALFWFAAMVYVLAVDPKPRMFEPVAAVAAACIGVLAAKRLRSGERLFPLLLVSVVVAGGIINAATAVRIDAAVSAAAREIHGSPTTVVDVKTAKFLALDPTADRLRLYPGQSGSRLLTLEPNHCPTSVTSGPDKWGLQREQRFERAQPAILHWMRQKRLLRPLEAPALCSFIIGQNR